ncbi:tautomerase family protein [Actibacterium ureilyticum]|uniref:tautomerase family protein n=1 Tax=Actibacterium ureilyticum TaxID=1590614 RepID=UPI000BAAA97F|nr:4-oxalocrotonate tautomerase family protein [Actibacterium ureilyticum]
MPLIQVKTFENELTDAQSEALIAKITDVVVEITSDKLRDVTWVVIDQVRDGHWGVGGRALGLDDVKAIMAS